MYTYVESEGISIIDYFAAKAMTAYISNCEWNTTSFEEIATAAYGMAAVMEEERKKRLKQE